MKAVSINAYEIESDDGETLVFMTPKEFEFIKNNKEKQDEEIDRLNNIIDETLEAVCYIEHNLEKYEEIGLDHLDYARNKVEELKEYLIEELKENKQ